MYIFQLYKIRVISADSVKQKSSVHFMFNAKIFQTDMDKIQHAL